MKTRLSRLCARSLAISALGVSAVGCSGGTAKNKNEADDENVTTTYGSFEEFERSVERIPETGIYVVNGDETIEDVKLLREYYERKMQSGALLGATAGGAIRKWSKEDKYNLRYCVSTALGPRKELVTNEMAAATAAWESVADVKFIHEYTEDSNCTSANPRVLFDVTLGPAGSGAVGRAFFSRRLP